MCAAVVLQVSSGGELLATVLLLADERLLAVVRAHVHLQPLQHVEALSAALGATPEHPVVPWRREKQTDEISAGVYRRQAGRVFELLQFPSSLAGKLSNKKAVQKPVRETGATGYLCVLR